MFTFWHINDTNYLAFKGYFGFLFVVEWNIVLAELPFAYCACARMTIDVRCKIVYLYFVFERNVGNRTRFEG